MQVLQKGRQVTDEEQKAEILSIIADRYSRMILAQIIDREKSVIDISMETRIPISTVYRKVQALADKKLVKVSGIINEEGKKLFLYRARIKTFKSVVDGDNVAIEVIPNLF